MLYACRGARELNAAFDRGASCALWFEEGTTITDRESFVAKMNEAKTCGIGRTGTTLKLSQVKGIIGARYYPTQMVDGPQLTPAYTVTANTGVGMGSITGPDGKGATPLNMFRAFLCTQVWPEKVTALNAPDVDSHLGYGMTTRQHKSVGEDYLLTNDRKIFLGNYAGQLMLYTGDTRTFTGTSTWSDWSYYFSWDCLDMSYRQMTGRADTFGTISTQFSIGAFNQVLLVQHRAYSSYYRQVTGYPADRRWAISYTDVGVCNASVNNRQHPFVPIVLGDVATDINTQLKFGMFGVRGYDYEFLCRITADEIEQPATYTPGTMPSLQSKIDLPKFKDMYLC